jgi:DNA modification methylase
MHTQTGNKARMNVDIYLGDALEVLKTLPDDSIDALVTDPPAGIEFMGKEWDSPWKAGFTNHGYDDGADRVAAPTQRVSTRNPMCKTCHKHIRGNGGCTCNSPESDEPAAFIHNKKIEQRDAFVSWLSTVMHEALRVLKPGAHALVWALPRTSYWTALALDNAGFEIRDRIAHAFGSGFPKSHNVGLSIDKLKGHSNRGHRIATASRYHPDGTLEPNGEELPPYEGKTIEGKQFQGFGTALKPAYELWIKARKPLTVVPLYDILQETHRILEAYLWSLSSVRFVAESLESSRRELPEVEFDSARWIAAAWFLAESRKLSELTDMFNSQEEGATFLSIALLWKGISVDVLKNGSTYTTRTEIELTTALRTLNSFLLGIIPEDTILVASSPSGLSCGALAAEKSSNERKTSSRTTQTPSVINNATHAVLSILANAAEGLSLTIDIQNGVFVPANATTDRFADEAGCWLARKPLSESTVAKNVLKWGTGALNIDACRAEGTVPQVTQGGKRSMAFGMAERQSEPHPKGRWPANLTHDGSEEVLEAFPQTAPSRSGVRNNHNRGSDEWGKGTFRDGPLYSTYNDSGSAARFFYCSKASKADRDEGCGELPVQQTIGGGGTNNTDDDVCGKYGSIKSPAHNNHPTVKATKLMRYLCRLITPPNGTVRDCFMGSGSTGKAAALEGFNFVGIEQDKGYFAIAHARITDAIGPLLATIHTHYPDTTPKQ